MSISRTGVYKSPKTALVSPIQSQTYRENQAEAEPVKAKTINMIVNWKFDSIPQRSFSFFMLSRKSTNIRTLSYRYSTVKFLFIGILKKNHIVVNKVVYFVSVINHWVIIDGHFV